MADAKDTRSFEQILKDFNESQTYNGNDKSDKFINEEEFWRIKTPTGSINPNNPFICVQILTEISKNDIGEPVYKWKEFGTFSSITGNGTTDVVDGGQSRNNYFGSMTLEDNGGGYSVNINLKDSEFDELEDALIRSRITSKMVIDENIAKSRTFYDINGDNNIDSFETFLALNPQLLAEGESSETLQKALLDYKSSELAQELSELATNREFTQSSTTAGTSTKSELGNRLTQLNEQSKEKKEMGLFEFSMADTEIINLRMQFGYYPPASSSNIFEGSDIATFSKKTHTDNKDKIVLKSPVINLYMLNSQFQFTQSGVSVSLKCFSMGKGVIDKAKLVQKNAAVKGAPQQIWWDLGKSLAKASNNQIVFLGSESFGGNAFYINSEKKALNKKKEGMTAINSETVGVDFMSHDISRSYTKVLSEIGSALSGQRISYKVTPTTAGATTPAASTDGIQLIPKTTELKTVTFTPIEINGVVSDKGQIAASSVSSITDKTYGLVVELITTTNPNGSTTRDQQKQDVIITDDVTSQVNILKKIKMTLGGEPKFEILPGEVKEIVQYKTLKEILNEFCNLSPKKYRLKNSSTGTDLIKEEYEVENQLSNQLLGTNTQSVINDNYEVIPLQWMIMEFETKEGEKKVKKTGIKFYYPNKKISNQDFIRLYTWRRSKISLIKNFNINSDLDFSNMETNVVYTNTDGTQTKNSSISGVNAGISSSFMQSKRDSNKISLVNYGFDTFNSKDTVQSIVANMNKILSKGSIEIPGDPFYLFDEKMNKYGYLIAINVFRNKSIAVNKPESGSSFVRERSYLSGFYLISKITHNISSGGFSTTLDLMKYYPTNKREGSLD